MTVWVLTEEINTGDSEHDTMIVGIYATEALALEAEQRVSHEARTLYDQDVYDEDGDPDTWDVSFEVTKYDVIEKRPKRGAEGD